MRRMLRSTSAPSPGSNGRPARARLAVRFAAGPLTAVAVAVVCGTNPAAARAQVGLPAMRSPIFLPPSYGATPISAQINAEANYLVGLGLLLESEAIARRHHAAAAEHEIRNSLLWVQTYFDRREINRAYQRKYHPPFLDQQTTAKRQVERKLIQLPQVAENGDPTELLNWMLHEVAADTLSGQLLESETGLLHSEVDEKLVAGDASRIRLTDGGREGGKVITFQADDPKLLETEWPRALRGAEFDEARAQFEAARDRAVREISAKGELNWETAESLCEAVDVLMATLNRVYTYDRRSTSAEFLVYRGGQQYVKSLAAAVFRLVDTSDTRVFDGTYAFQGDSVVALIGHLCRYGLEFAPPEKGSEGTYRKLFFAMRRVFEHLNPDAGLPEDEGS